MLLASLQPGTKAQLKPTFPKDASGKKDKKEDKAAGNNDDDDGSTTETDERIRKWIATGDLRAQEAGGLHGDLMHDIEEDAEVSTPTQMPGALPIPIPGSEPRGREASSGSARANSASVPPPGTRRINPLFPAPEGLEKVQLVVKWGGEVRSLDRLGSLPLQPRQLTPLHPLSPCSRPTPRVTSPRTSARTSRRTSRS